MSFLVSKDRKVKFACVLTIHQLENLPYLTGQYFAKWKLPAATVKGVTSRATVVNHTVVWEAKYAFDTTFIISREGFLKPQELEIIVKQDLDGGEYSERLGIVKFCLTDYVKTGTGTDRYLLQNAKLNSILKLTIKMQLLEGSENRFAIGADSARLSAASHNPVSSFVEETVIKNEPDMNYNFNELDLIDPENSESALVESFFQRARDELQNR